MEKPSEHVITIKFTRNRRTAAKTKFERKQVTIWSFIQGNVSSKKQLRKYFELNIDVLTHVYNIVLVLKLNDLVQNIRSVTEKVGGYGFNARPRPCVLLYVLKNVFILIL